MTDRGYRCCLEEGKERCQEMSVRKETWMSADGNQEGNHENVDLPASYHPPILPALSRASFHGSSFYKYSIGPSKRKKTLTQLTVLFPSYISHFLAVYLVAAVLNPCILAPVPGCVQRADEGSIVIEGEIDLF